MADSQSLRCLNLLAQEMSTCEQASPCPLNATGTSQMAKSELISFGSEEENTLDDCVSSLDACKESSSLLSHHSEPVLSSHKCLSRLWPLDSNTSSKSLSQVWLDRLKLSNLAHLVRK